MNLDEITSAQELKALAFDVIQRLEIEQRNLQMIQQRLAQLKSLDETPKGK